MNIFKKLWNKVKELANKVKNWFKENKDTVEDLVITGGFVAAGVGIVHGIHKMAKAESMRPLYPSAEVAKEEIRKLGRFYDKYGYLEKSPFIHIQSNKNYPVQDVDIGNDRAVVFKNEAFIHMQPGLYDDNDPCTLDYFGQAGKDIIAVMNEQTKFHAAPYTHVSDVTITMDAIKPIEATVVEEDNNG
jgi:hypothetical protein